MCHLICLITHNSKFVPEIVAAVAQKSEPIRSYGQAYEWGLVRTGAYISGEIRCAEFLRIAQNRRKWLSIRNDLNSMSFLS